MFVGALVMVATFLVMRWQPLTTDENEQFLAAVAWPSNALLIPHVQGYVHVTQAAFAIAGQTTDAARLTVLIPNLISLAMLPWLTQLSFGSVLSRTQLWLATALALALFSLSPLVIQNSLLLDPDAGLLTTATTLQVAVWLASRHTPEPMRIGFNAATLLFAVWVKETTPFLVIAGIFGFDLLSGRFRMAVSTIIAALVGTVLFVFSHLLYSAITGFSLLDAVGKSLGLVSVLGGGRAGAAGESLSRAVQSLGVFALWFGIPLVLICAAGLPGVLHRLLTRRLNETDLLWLLGVGIVLSYGLMFIPAWGYPRYQTPALPLLFVWISGFVAARIPLNPRLFVLGVLGFFVGIAQIVVLGDPLLALYRATFDTTGYFERLRIAAFPATTILALTGVASLGGVLVLRSRASPFAGAVVGLLVGALGMSAALDLVQVPASYSTRYRYSYRFADRAEAIVRVKQRVPENGFIVADKDILWYVDRPGVPIYDYVCQGCEPEPFVRFIKEKNLQAIVWSQKEWLKASLVNADPTLSEYLVRCYDRAEFGVFTVLTRIDNQFCRS